MAEYNISFAGAGRVAGILCRELYRKGFRISKIVSKSESAGSLLAESCNARWSATPEFNDSEDLILVSVPDHALPGVLKSISCPDKCVVAHTAGSYGLELFPSGLKNTGVFYPLQTFSTGRTIDFNGLPVFIEGNNEHTLKILEKVASSLEARVFHADSGQRQLLHVAAVFVCNFTNFMLTEGHDLALKAGFPTDILDPLIKETFAKSAENGPVLSQTGPAVRNDAGTIKKHLELLSFSPDLQKLYRELTNSIMDYYKNSHGKL